MPRIEIGAGIVLAIAAPLGLLNDVWIIVGLGLFALILIVHGAYDEWIKPRFRIEHRLTDWLVRRSWKVSVERKPALNFLIRASSGSSGYEISITRQKDARDDLIGFTGVVPLPDDGSIEQLETFSAIERLILISDIRIVIASAGLGFEFLKSPDQRIFWPPQVIIQAAIPQDHTLSQHGIDITGKSVESVIITARDVIRKAALAHITSPQSIPDMEAAPPESAL
jgi:hypothetical protein